MKGLLSVAIGAVFAILFASSVHALDVPKAPSLSRPIVDTVSVLSSSQIDKLSAQITDSRSKKDYQLAVLVVPRLTGTTLEDYSLKVARTWGVGDKVKNNGILLLVVIDDRRMRIEVGSGLEGAVTDVQSGHIIRDVIAPKFRSENYYAGIHDGIESIAALVEGKADPHVSASNEVKGIGSIIEVVASAVVFVLFILVWLVSILARTKSWWAGGVAGVAIGIIIAFVVGWTLWSILAVVGLLLAGLGLDFMVSRDYKKHKANGTDPSWWAGGTILGGGLGGGSGGSFGGGGFSGGGSSGGW